LLHLLRLARALPIGGGCLTLVRCLIGLTVVLLPLSLRWLAVAFTLPFLGRFFAVLRMHQHGRSGEGQEY